MQRRFSEEQIIRIVKEHQAGASVNELCRKHGMSDSSFYIWKAKFGGMEVCEKAGLRKLETENAKLKHLLRNLLLDMTALEKDLKRLEP